MFLQLKGQLLDKLFTKGGGEGWLAFCCLALCTLHSCNGYWNGKVKRKGIVSENSEDIYIFFHIPLLLFWLHTCSSPRLTNGSQGSCRTSIFISYIIYVCVYKYVSHLRLWVHSCMSACGSFNSQSIQKGTKSMSSEQC